MSREILLVGSVPLANASEVFRAANAALGNRVSRLPDGETGPARSLWFQCQIPVLMAHRQLESVEPDPAHPGSWRRARIPSTGIYNNTMETYYRGRVRLRPDVDPASLQLDNLGYGDWALESYAVFSRLKADGIIPRSLRFQVCIPTPGVIALMAVPSQLSLLLPAYRESLFAEIDKIASAIPADELAIQWDCTEPPNYEHSPTSMRLQTLQNLIALADGVPTGVELGYHLCYGDFEHRHAVEPPDLSGVVDIANGLTDGASRAINWVHMPVPRDRDDEAYFAPLPDLRLSSETKLFLGLVHHTDGVEGTRRRMSTASRFRDDFGIATECGFGRRSPTTVGKLLAIHAEAADVAIRT
jgi:hypothetical protein